MGERTSFINRFRMWIEGKSWIFPWISLLWGLFSGVIIARDFAHGWRLLTFSIALMLFSLLATLWLIWKERLAARAENLSGLAARVHAKSSWVDWAATTAVQMAVQYVVMFSLTFLFFSRAWVLLIVTLLLGVTIMWDPWFQRGMRSVAYESAIRALGVMLASSFIISVFFPWAMPVYGVIVGTISCLAALPWRHLLRAEVRLSRLPVLLRDTVPFFLVAATAIYSGNRGRLIPPLSVWVQHGTLGEGVTERQLDAVFSSEVSKARFVEAQTGAGVCCLTPLVAPRALRVGVVHEWRRNGRLLDVIPLGEAAGLDGAGAFRTFSCKKSFPPLAVGDRLECATVLASGQEVGRAVVEID